ncbi:four-carbon acid sugar kinase family protein [Providencia rettgeri]|uniref:D-threonate kinase n=1 Tax=Providencia rettgeri TaxID=587 RepID=UPI0034E0BDEA
MKLLVIADDFTGANDTGVQFAKKQARTEILLDSQQKHSWFADVVVLNTESRALTPENASEIIRGSIKPFLTTPQPPIIYKKIDSTFRGNIGAEIETIMKAAQLSVAIVAAAIPAAGRTTVNGECLVNGVPLLDTEFASDPKTPIISSRIKTIINHQSNLGVQEVDLAVVRSSHLQQNLQELAAKQPVVIVIDAQNDDDLNLIAEATLALNQPCLLVGAAGFANALPKHSYTQERSELPLFIVAGSMSSATIEQVSYAQKHCNASVIDVEMKQIIDAATSEDYMAVLIKKIGQELNQKKHTIIRTCRDVEERHHIDDLCSTYGLTRNELGKSVSNFISLLTLNTLSVASIGGLFLTGGDIAIAVANTLGAKGYRIQSEVLPCIPCGTFIDSEIDDLPVITKAGGFGQITTLCEAIKYIEEVYREK